MQELNLQVPYQLNMILEIISKEVKENGFTDEDYCLYAHKKTITPELICYLDLYPTVSDDDKDIYPDFIIKENYIINCMYQCNNTSRDYWKRLN